MRSPSLISRSPATFGLIGLLIVFFLIGWGATSHDFLNSLAFQPANFVSAPWTILTYWLVQPIGGFLLWILFEWYWLWLMGAPLEEKLGSRGLLIIFLAGAVLTAIGFSLGALIHDRTGAMLVFPETAICCLSALWAAHFGQGQVCFWGFRIKAFWIAVFYCGVSVIHIGYGAPLLGVMAVAPALLFWLYGTRGREAFGIKKKVVKDSRGRQYGSQKEFDEFIDTVREKEKKREEQERLRKLFEGSLEDDDKK